MRSLLLLLCAVGLAAPLCAQRNYNLELLANVDFAEASERGNDCWGYVSPGGVEYAIIGSTAATYVYSLEDGAAPRLRARISGANSIWRDFKTFGEFVYVVADQGTDGLLAIDMSKAPDTITHTFNQLPTEEGVITQAHNLYITETGLLVLAGGNVGRGEPLFFDLNEDPRVPPFVGAARPVYAHDVYAEGGRLYSSDIFAGELAIHDYDSLGAIRLLGTRQTSFDFTHNAWLKDTSFAFTTDERAGAFVDAYDVKDPAAIRRVDRFRPDESFASGSAPHNTHVRGDYLVTSWYRDGIVLTDATRPHNLIEVGKYDTYPQGGGAGFDGCWGAYPYLPSGRLIASDRESGLFVFAPTYEQGCYFEGTVQDSTTGELLAGVTVDLDDRPAQRVTTDLDGAYATGLHQEGAYRVTYSKEGYVSKSVVAQLRRGRLTFRNVKLRRVLANTFTVTAVDETGTPIPDAAVETIYRATEGKRNRYDIYVAKWGFRPTVIADTLLDEGADVSIEVELARGYADDFTVDLGWETSGTALRGLWDRGVPTETVFNNTVVQLGRDVANDFGEKAYGTAVGGQSATDLDVDGGTAVLTSPVFRLDAAEDARIAFAYHFAVFGGAEEKDDTLTVTLVREDGPAVVLLNTSENTGTYRRFRSAPIRDLVGVIDGPVEGLRLVVATQDLASAGHIVEALFDDFSVGVVVGPPLRAGVTYACAPATVTFAFDEAQPGASIDAAGATDVSFDGTTITATYPEAGTYGLALSTLDDDGEPVTYRYPALLTVREVPTANFRFAVRDTAIVDFTSEATDATALRWDFGDGRTAAIARPTHRYRASGVYDVSLAASSVCGADTSTQAVSVTLVGLADFAQATGLRIIGNPADQRLRIDYDADEPVLIELVDARGGVALSRKLGTPGRHNLDTGTLPAGTYFLHAHRSRGTIAATQVIIRH